MLQTLHRRLILSHILPILLLMPVGGVLLTYLLENYVVLRNLSISLMGQAVLIAEMARTEPQIWQSNEQTNRFLERVNPLIPAQVTLLDIQGRDVLATPGAQGYRAMEEDLARLLAGERLVQLRPSRNPRSEIVEIMVPVEDASGTVVGIVRISQQLGDVYERFQRLRYVVTSVLLVGLAVGVLLGAFLAVTIERPIRRVTEKVGRLASGNRTVPLEESGPREIRELSRAMNLLVKQLKTLERSRRHLLANLVHELGRPLGAMNSAVQALLRGAEREPELRHDLLKGIEGEIRRLQRIVDNVAQSHDRLVGALELDRQPIHLQEWLPQTLAPWMEDALRQDLQWETKIPQDLPIVYMDADRIAQAIGNLMSNAIKYTAPGGRIVVSTLHTPLKVGIRIEDSGAGIAPADHTRIFEPFERAQVGHRFPQGMGLGLAITRDLVEAHGGSIDLRSELGQGSQFTIWLPLAPPPTPIT